MQHRAPEERVLDTRHFKTGHHGRGDRDLQLLIESLSPGLLIFSLSPKRNLAVRMWESRVLGEISNALWKPFCGFHGDVICIAIFGIAHVRADRGGCCTLAGVPIVVPRGSYAVVLDRRTAPPAQRQSSIHVATRDTWFYFVASSARKSVWTLVRQLLGPHLSTCAWCKIRSSSAVTAAVSPRSLPQSTTGRFDVS